MNNLWKNLKVIFTLPIMLFIAWVMAHLMAIFGIFTVVAYPVWVLVFGKKTICFGCARKHEGEICPLCKEKVNSKEIYPKNWRSIRLNSLVLLLLTLLSISVVYLESIVIERSGILSVGKTVSFNIPDRSQYRTHEIFPMKVEISGINTSINVVQADISFDPELLEVVDLSTKDSFSTIFVQKDINNTLGYVRLSGGIPTPGFSDPSGTFGTIYFKARSSGLANVSFLPTSMVLADDGRGTNVLKSFPTVSYIIKPESLTSDEEISQAAFFNKDVLGAQTDTEEDNSNVCKIELVNPEKDNVLGIQDELVKGVADKVDNTGNLYTYVLQPLLNALGGLDDLILGLYRNFFANAFTK